MDASRTQMVQCQIAGSLEDKRFKMIDGPLTESADHSQVGLLQQVFGGAVIVDHSLQRA
jgi:hypothetical protein